MPIFHNFLRVRLLSVKSELHSVLASATATLPGLDLSDGNGSTLNDSVETMIRANLAHDFEEHHNIPDPAAGCLTWRVFVGTFLCFFRCEWEYVYIIMYNLQLCPAKKKQGI